MARYTEAACRICRRENQKLFLKGDRCYSDKCALTRRAAAPGQHGKMKKKLSEYGTQLREKQKARRYYGILEGQMATYFEMAEKQSGMAGENLLRILESRLDNVVYRVGFAMSRPEARQIVVHGHITVNGRKVDIPSYLLKEGDVIAIREKSKGSEKIKAVLEANASKPTPKWLDVDRAAVSAKVVSLPNKDEIDFPVEEHLIVEYYSK